jgi:hypothetical protein
MTEKGKLTTLLNYLIEHNREHSEELTELAEKVKKVANDVIREDIQEAARLMNESTEYLKQALMKLRKD